MPAEELFDSADFRKARGDLDSAQREAAVKDIVRRARLGRKYFYSLQETCAILRCSYDELDTTLHRYRLDAVLFLSVYRIPWYTLCGYLLDDEDDDLEEALDEYLEKTARRDTSGCARRPR